MASADRYATPAGNSTPSVGSRYASPSAVPPTAGSGSYNTPPAASYPPVNTSGSGGFAPANPSNPASTNPQYRSGRQSLRSAGRILRPAGQRRQRSARLSTRQHQRLRAATRRDQFGCVSSMPTTTSSVTPASYTQPAAGAGM